MKKNNSGGNLYTEFAAPSLRNDKLVEIFCLIKLKRMIFLCYDNDIIFVPLNLQNYKKASSYLHNNSSDFTFL